MENGNEIWYYLYDGHGSVRTLTNEAGRVTDRYAYGAYGNLLEKEGDSKNEFLYTGEQYNANTGLYYLRARYMNPSTGAFISIDSYQGSIYDPVTLHKYLYANANPVMYTDPSGYMGLAMEASVYADCTTSMAVAEACYNAMVFSIGMQIISQLRAIIAVESATHISSETITSIGIEGALSGKHVEEMTDHVLMEMLDVITLAYMVAGDCIALDVVSTTVTETKAWIETSEVELRKENRKKFKGHCVYVLRDSKNGNKVSYVGRSKNPWKRYLRHKKDLSKQTDGKPWDMYIVKSGLTKKEAAALENALICIYTIDALANARHEIAVKNFKGFEKEFGRAASICKMPLTQLKDVMKGDYK